MKKNLFLFSIFYFAYTFSHAQCGSERQKVKTLSDKDTTAIRFSNIQNASVHYLVNKPATVPDYHKGPRLQPEETTVYKVKCQLVNYKQESNDGDYHLVIIDLSTKEKMVAEMVDPDCVGHTSHKDEFAKVRRDFTEKIGTPLKDKFQKKFKYRLIELKGISYFDKKHGVTSSAKNRRELHPVIGFIVLD